MLIEETFNSSDYNTESSSFYIDDSRITVNTVVGVYVKAFYTNSGIAYLTPLAEWQEVFASSGFIVSQISPGRVRLFDSGRDLEGQIVVVTLMQ